MRKIITLIVFMLPALFINAQLTETERQSIDAGLKTGKLNVEQYNQLRKKWSIRSFPELHKNDAGEINISDTLTFTSLDKKVIFQRCLQWIAINYGDIVHKDDESGKIIAYGLIDLKHYADYPGGLRSRIIEQIVTPANYVMILTLNDNRIKYTITNINYNFINFSETINEISLPLPSLFSDKTYDQQWIRFFTVVIATVDKFFISLKQDLVNYINEVNNDYKF